MKVKPLKHSVDILICFWWNGHALALTKFSVSCFIYDALQNCLSMMEIILFIEKLYEQTGILYWFLKSNLFLLQKANENFLRLGINANRIWPLLFLDLIAFDPSRWLRWITICIIIHLSWTQLLNVVKENVIYCVHSAFWLPFFNTIDYQTIRNCYKNFILVLYYNNTRYYFIYTKTFYRF